MVSHRNVQIGLALVELFVTLDGYVVEVVELPVDLVPYIPKVGVGGDGILSYKLVYPCFHAHFG